MAHPRQHGLARIVLFNTSSNVLKLVLTLVVTFFMTPVYLHALGDYDYGIWSIIGSIVGYLGLMDIGLKPTISRFIARLDPRTEHEDWHRVYSTGIVLMAAVGSLVGAAFLVWSLVAPQSLAPATGPSTRYALFLQLMALQVLLTFPRLGLESTFQGTQRYVVMNNISMAHTIVASAFLYRYISLWDPLLTLAAVNVVVSVSKMILFLAFLAPKGERIRLPSPRMWDARLAREMYAFGFKSFAQSASGTVENRTDVLVIGTVLGPAVVPFYSIPQMLVARIRDLTRTLSHALLPAFSAMDSGGRSEQMRRVFFESSRLIVGILTLMSVGAVTLGLPFIRLWIGERFVDNGAAILYILISYMFIANAMPVGSRYLTALNRHGILAKISIVRALLNLVFSLVLVHPLGAAGVALGSLLATGLTMWVDWRAALKPLETSLAAYFGRTLLPCLLPAAGFAAVALGAGRMGWTANWPGFLATGAACSLVFAGLFVTLALGPTDRRRLSALLLPGARART